MIVPGQNTISRRGTTVHLEPKVMEVLACLAQQAGQTVSKGTLFESVWRGTVVTDDVLTRCIVELRRAFDDDAREPRIIQTIPKRGYRLIAPVTAAATVVPTPSAARDSVVVLPFVNMSADPENEYFADGITEEIINALAQIRELHVVARSSAFTFKAKHIDPRIVGEQLKVRTILEGSVRRADNRLRITAQLINAADGYHLWSDRYDREMKDVFEIQDEIARGIAARLKVTLEGGDEQPLFRSGTRNLEAYQLYLKGRALLPRRNAFKQSVACFEQAVALDAHYAQAWAGIADAYTVLAYMGITHPDAAVPKALEAARRAVALDSSLAECQNALAIASLMCAWDRATAERAFLRALEMNPRYTQARDWYAMYYLLFSEGRTADAVAEARAALESDPLSSYAHTMYGFVCAYAGDSERGLEAARRAVELDADSYLARFALQEVLRVAGRLEESVAAAETALAMSGRHAWAMVFLAHAFADWGKTASADAIYAELLARSLYQYVAPTALAAVAAAASRENDVIRHARQALEIRDPNAFMLARNTRISGRLYAYQQFRETIALMGRDDWLRD
jgi:serine/threonine-protein kinase